MRSDRPIVVAGLQLDISVSFRALGHVLEEYLAVIRAAVWKDDAATAKCDSRDVIHCGWSRVNGERRGQHDRRRLQIEEEQTPKSVLLKDLGRLFPEVQLRVGRMVAQAGTSFDASP
jgi:hypothetical protein